MGLRLAALGAAGAPLSLIYSCPARLISEEIFSFPNCARLIPEITF